MSATLVRSSWTGTKGLISLIEEDFDQFDDMELKEKSFDSKASDDGFSTKFVAVVWDWARREFGKDAKNMTMVELAEYWYEFA